MSREPHLSDTCEMRWFRISFKATGNEAFQANKFAEAEKRCTAASHAQGHIANAIVDYSRAMALDPKYLKAISRRMILHNMIHNYGQAISDLERLITLQEIEQRNVTGGLLRRTQSSCNNAQDLKDAREHLTKAQENMKKGIPLDHYLILGVERSSTAAETKKAYRKAALKHHPDKAMQFLVRSDVGEDELLKECGNEVHRDAEKLFQMIAKHMQFFQILASAFGMMLKKNYGNCKQRGVLV